MKARVFVSLKTTVLDPQGKTVRAALQGLGYPAIEDVRQGGLSHLRLDEGVHERLLHAAHGDVHLVMGCSNGFSKRSVGYVGSSDGWQDLMEAPLDSDRAVMRALGRPVVTSTSLDA